MNQIITPNPPETKEAAASEPQKLLLKTAQEIGGALARLAEIGQGKIIEATTAAERRGLEQFIISNMAAHAQEFLTCWFLIRGEYEPLCQALNAILRRAMPPMKIQQSLPAPLPLTKISDLPETALKDTSLASREPVHPANVPAEQCANAATS